MQVLILFVLMPFLVLSQNIENVEIEIQTDEINRRLIIKKAINEVSRSFVQNFLGKDKFNIERSKIEKVIIKNQNRYILFTKMNKSLEQENGSYITKVSLGLSKENLKALLVEHNLFYASQGASCVLPIVTFKTDIKDKSQYIWWNQSFEGTQTRSKNLAKIFYSSLNQELIKNGFYSVDPVFSKTYESIPKVFLPKGRQAKHFKKLSQFLSCDIILSGSVQIQPNPKESFVIAEFSFIIFNIKTKQKLFDINKNMRLIYSENKNHIQKSFHLQLSSVLNSIMFQLSSYKDKGSLDLNRRIISVQGPLNYYQKEKFKNYLLKHIPSLKNLKERLLVSHKIVYEAEISKDIFTLIREIKKHSKKSLFKIKVTSYNKQQIDIYVTEK